VFTTTTSLLDSEKRKKDNEQKRRVSQNKREFVAQMLPWVDEFRSIPTTNPAKSAKGKNMHTSYASLLQNVLTVFEKYGYKEYLPGTVVAVHTVCSQSCV
jgi:molecular chaperone GrpE (heat shock protein)